jgi:hypothetical protein
MNRIGMIVDLSHTHSECAKQVNLNFIWYKDCKYNLNFFFSRY